MKASELREKRAGLVAEARGILNKASGEKRGLASEEQSRWDALMKQVDSMKVEVDTLARQESLELELRQPQGPPPPRNDPGETPGGPVDGNAGRGTAERWVDSHGRELRVFGPGQRFSESGRSTGVFDALADLVRASPRSERSLLGASDGSGGFALPGAMSTEILDAVRANSVCLPRVTTIEMESSELGIAKIDSDCVATWASELVSLPDGAPGFGKLTLRARTLRVFIELSQEIVDDIANLAGFLRSSLSAALGQKLDAAIIGDSAAGLGEAPVGIRTAVGVNELTSISSPLFDDLIDGAKECRLDNAPGRLQAIIHPRDAAVLAKLKDSQGQYLTPPAAFNELELLQTTAVSVVEGAGAESFMLVGPLNTAVLGLRMSAQIFLSRDLSDASKFARGLVCALRADVGLPRPAYFTRLLGVT